MKQQTEKFVKIYKKTHVPESRFLIKLHAEKFIKIHKKTSLLEPGF